MDENPWNGEETPPLETSQQPSPHPALPILILVKFVVFYLPPTLIYFPFSKKNNAGLVCGVSVPASSELGLFCYLKLNIPVPYLCEPTLFSFLLMPTGANALLHRPISTPSLPKAVSDDWVSFSYMVFSQLAYPLIAIIVVDIVRVLQTGHEN